MLYAYAYGHTHMGHIHFKNESMSAPKCLRLQDPSPGAWPRGDKIGDGEWNSDARDCGQTIACRKQILCEFLIFSLQWGKGP